MSEIEVRQTWPECGAYHDDTDPHPAVALAPQSDDLGVTIFRWTPVCEHELPTWWECCGWEGTFAILTVPVKP